MTGVQNHKFHTLDAMRGVAAAAVVIYHFRGLLFPPAGGWAGFQSGYLAVDLFFLLSGFVVAHAYDRRLESGTRTRDFIALRAIRLLPMIWFGMAIGATYFFLRYGISPRSSATIVVNLFVLPALWNGHPFDANAVEWSLFFELAANAGFAAAFTLLRGRTLVAIIAVAALGLIACVVHFGDAKGGYSRATLHVGAMRVGYSFFLGVLIYRTRARWSRRWPRFDPVALLAVTAVALFIPVTGHARIAYDLAFVLVGSPLLVMSAALVAQGDRGTRAAIAFGALSYPLYAVHVPILNFAEWLGSATRFPGVAAAVLGMVTSAAVAWFLARNYDPAIRAWLTRLLLPARSDRPAPAGATRRPQPG